MQNNLTLLDQCNLQYIHDDNTQRRNLVVLCNMVASHICQGKLTNTTNQQMRHLMYQKTWKSKYTTIEHKSINFLNNTNQQSLLVNQLSKLKTNQHEINNHLKHIQQYIKQLRHVVKLVKLSLLSIKWQLKTCLFFCRYTWHCLS